VSVTPPIKEAMDRRIAKVKSAFLVCWLVLVLSFVIRGHVMPLLLAVLFALALIAFAGCLVYLLRFTKCPKCGYSLGNAMFQSRGALGTESNVNFCPRCGLDLNQPQA